MQHTKLTMASAQQLAWRHAKNMEYYAQSQSTMQGSGMEMNNSYQRRMLPRGWETGAKRYTETAAL